LNVVSIEEEGSDINIYPNPSGGELYISVGKKIQSTGLYKLEIYSVDGELVDSFYRESSNDLIKLNIDSLQTGMYFLRFESGDGLVYSHRLIKK
jgi:hypothetical protein